VRKLPFLLLLIAVTGCKSNQPFPAKVQPAEFDVYHAYLLHYAKTYPQDEKQLYITETASGGSFMVGEGDNPKMRKAFEECLSPKAHAAFLALHHPNPNDLGGTSSIAWRTLPDGKVLPLMSSLNDSKAPMTSISFSRVFFEADGKEAYLNTGVRKCNGACGGGSMLWHAVREGDSWIFNSTKCYGLD
jgi:hypothetical protein